MGKQRPYLATTEQVWALHAAMPPYLPGSILLGAMAGLRCAEACGLRPGDIDLALGIVMPRLQYPAEPLKSNGLMTMRQLAPADCRATRPHGLVAGRDRARRR